MTFYEMILELSKYHLRMNLSGGFSDLIRFDLTEKSIYNGKTVLMENGAVVIDRIELSNGVVFEDIKNMPLITDNKEDYFSVIEKLHEEFLFSAPCSTFNYSNSNFKPKKSDDMTTDQLLNGKPRIQAQYSLEGYILLHSVLGNLSGVCNSKWFFYQLENSKLVLFKSWLERRVERKQKEEIAEVSAEV